METYDAIVVGARCAGSPTAMLLARKGYRVLMVDRVAFPSDTLSTLLIHPPGVAALRRFGVLDRLRATGCPPLRTYSYDFGAFTICGSPRGAEGADSPYAPRRTVLDALLVEAAVDAGAELREGFTVEELLWADGVAIGLRGRSRGSGSVVAKARVVIGADGRNSTVARAVRPHRYNEVPPLQVGYYAYWSGLPADGLETYIRPSRGVGVIPTHDELTLVVTGWPRAELKANRRDVEGAYMRTLELVPELAERVHAAERQSRFEGGSVPNWFRKPYGPGWVLVGDAGYDKDPLTAWGISDAFWSAERCATALDEWLTGTRAFDDAMADYQRERDERSLPMFELTCGFATLQPPPAEMQALLATVAGDQAEMDAFASTMAGTHPVAEFFGPANVERILGAPV